MVRTSIVLSILLACFVAIPTALAQDIEPRRWTPLPTGTNVVGSAVGYTTGDIFFNPVLQLEDTEFKLAIGALAYLRSFDFIGRSARIDFTLPYGSGRWAGLLRGEPATVRRRGFMDPRIRLSVLLYGAPAQTPEEFQASEKSAWVVGAAVSVSLPYGHYLEDRLINLGNNRWIIRPQLGVTYTRANWTYELTGSMFWYQDNDEFFEGAELKNDPLYALQAHVIYTFKPGLWASLSTAYGHGKDAFLNGAPTELQTRNWAAAISVGLPINRQQGIRLAWVRLRTDNDDNADFDSLVLAWSLAF